MRGQGHFWACSACVVGFQLELRNSSMELRSGETWPLKVLTDLEAEKLLEYALNPDA